MSPSLTYMVLPHAHLYPSSPVSPNYLSRTKNMIILFPYNILESVPCYWGFPGVTSGKEPSANSGDIRDACFIPESRRSPGGINGSPLWYPCLKNSMDRGAWQATVHGSVESDTTDWLSVCACMYSSLLPEDNVPIITLSHDTF